MKLTLNSMRHRAKELEPLRKQAFEMFDQNPDLRPIVLAERLGVHRSTAQTWKGRWRRSRGLPAVEKKKHQIKHVVWEQLVKNVPDIETLGILTVQGFMTELKRRDDAIEAIKQENIQLQSKLSAKAKELEEVTKERNRLMHLHNEGIARGKIGVVTLDQVRHRIVPEG